ncbi:carboxypeptidase regulatory-like domain-containing protein [Mucilaginibacter sp.]|uniref:carboxypeptidase-like regulatory domain-containing protein n=1 Tax=Mucilaginibacter sp. TaxID=1882438 RepID=UPI003D0DA8D3
MTKTAKLYNDYPIERVYLHFDKPYYAVGDTIWFKAYLTMDQHLLSPISKIIYVDILAAHDSLVQTLKLPVKNGVAWADIPLSQYSFKKGNYRVVAYTNWMNNSDVAYFFNKNITIGDIINSDMATQISLKRSVVSKTSKISAGIYYKNDKGEPYADKKVTWTVQRDFEDIMKGKGNTDKNGFIDISFYNPKNYTLDSATLITTIDKGDRRQGGAIFPLKSIAKPNDFQFFAEGGQLITGLKSKIAFKATKSTGLGIDVKGTITDNTNKVAAEFSSSHLGMGVFDFTPEAGKTYTANVTFADGSTTTADLPKVFNDAIALGIDNTDPDNLKVKLQADAAFLKDYQGKTFFILAKSAGVICFAAQTKLESQFYSSSIPKNKFPTGIVQVTLFTEDGEPLSERIAFIQHNDQLNLSIASEHPTYNTRQKVKLNVIAKFNGAPVDGNFSMTVIDDSKVPFDENSESTILTNLLLTADIAGYIEKPNYYFNQPDDKKRADLDILLQTQGYRRFNYEGILNDKYPAISFLPEQGIVLTGTLRASNGIPVNRGNVGLLIKDKHYSENTITDADGRFRFSNLVFSDSTQLNLSARNNPRASDLVLTVDGDPNQRIAVNPNTPDEIINIDSTLSSYMQNSKLHYSYAHVLKEVVIKDKRIVKTASHSDYSNTSSLGSQPDHMITTNMLTNCGNNALDCIKGMAMGMIYDQGNFYVMRDYNQGKKVPVQVFVKGMPVDANYLDNISPMSIESVEVFLKDDLGLVNSANNSNGALVVNMKKIESTKISLQQLKDMIPLKNELTFAPKGYEIKRAFYLPRYSGPRETQPNQIDTRSTIYWNPNISTDKTTGTTSVEFFNADGKGTYRAIIEGIDKDGNIGRQLFRYTVK